MLISSRTSTLAVLATVLNLFAALYFVVILVTILLQQCNCTSLPKSSFWF
ncbi:exported protein of unknown function (plasmid) [Cupriavidus taiwanensis]|uniref:Uncharacterized protein n=1 Tax=Cupriavidus taiwanensis TaxID=164546 RepID=A0A375IS05_9BURK|nr:hypothetical protein [Cupriavidus taiwanensis]SPK77466.1 exported protein of unknown function [Cupriavidus taiwanensis]